MTDSEDASPTRIAAGLRAGVIGLGMIGGGVAANLAAAGVPTTAFDVRPDAYEKVDGIDRQAASPADVARTSDVVVLAVVNAAQAHEVLAADDGVLSTAEPGTIVVLLSTVSVPDVKQLATLCAEHSVGFLDAGVTQAGEGKLVVMLGGDAETVERATPVLDPFAKALLHCGALGAGMVTKLARNAITYGNWAVVREAVSLAVAGGVDPERVLAVMEAAGESGPTPASQLRMQVNGQGLPPEHVAYANALAQKDLGAAQEFAGSVDLQTPIIDVVRPRMVETFSGSFTAPLPKDKWEKGLEVMRRVYGEMEVEIPHDTSMPAVIDTVENLFGNIWARGNLSTRDRRLLVLGATLVMGRQDLLETQLRGALHNEEFTVAQLRELEYFANYYTSVEQGTAMLHVAEKLIAEINHRD